MLRNDNGYYFILFFNSIFEKYRASMVWMVKFHFCRDRVYLFTYMNLYIKGLTGSNEVVAKVWGCG